MLLAALIKSSKSIRASVLIVSYIILMMTVYLLRLQDYFIDSVGNQFYFNDNDHTLVLNMYTAIALITVIADYTVTKIDNVGFDIQNVIMSINQRLIFHPLIIIFIYFVLTLNIYYLDKDIIWKNSIYLLMNGPEAYEVSYTIALLLKVMLSFIGLLLAILLTLAIYLKRFDIFSILFFPFLFCLFYQLSSHSRIASVYIFIIFMLSYVCTVSKLRKFTFSPLILFIGIFFLVFALQGRGTGLHGFGNLLNSAIVGFTNFTTENLSFALVNFSQGIFVTAEGLGVNKEHSMIYKVLSFSPFPSFIDGFSSIRDKEEIRVNYFMPMSALAELVKFGQPYILIFYFIYFWVIRRLTLVIFNNPNIFSFLINVYFMMIFIILNAYSLRNGFRQLLFLLLITYLLSFFKKYRGIRIGSLNVSFKK